jgi:hypothetical protein
MNKFKALPKPSVLRVGFEVEGTKRGDDYDSNPLRMPSISAFLPPKRLNERL